MGLPFRRLWLISNFLFWPIACGAVSLPQIAHRSGRVRSDTIELKNLDGHHQYSLLYSLSSLRDLGPAARAFSFALKPPKAVTFCK